MNNYLIRRAIHHNDGKQLNSLFTKVFFPEEVGVLAETLYNDFPGFEHKNWFIAEETATKQIVSAFALIPWKWEIDGIPLKVAEMGIVGTDEKHRGKGIMKVLNREFDKALAEEEYDISVIQGIPGFYHRFGFYYSVSLENHINIPLQSISCLKEDDSFSFRLSDMNDIPFLMKEDEEYRRGNFISSCRNEGQWKYLLSDGLKTELASEFWIMTDKESGESYYFRIHLKGFGTGLIVSEVSENISCKACYCLFRFCSEKAVEREKPYIRLNIHNEASVSKIAFSIGAVPWKMYAWQIKIPDKIRFLSKIIPLLEKRMKNSFFNDYSGIFRLNFYQENIDILWQNGSVKSITGGGETGGTHVFNVPNDLFPALALGYVGWEDLQKFRPDISPEPLYVCSKKEDLTDVTGLIANVLFPAKKSWIYSQY